MQNMKVTVISISGSWIGPQKSEKRLGEQEINERIETIQTTALLKTSGIPWRILEIRGYLLSSRLTWKSTRWRWCIKFAENNYKNNNNDNTTTINNNNINAAIHIRVCARVFMYVYVAVCVCVCSGVYVCTYALSSCQIHYNLLFHYKCINVLINLSLKCFYIFSSILLLIPYTRVGWKVHIKMSYYGIKPVVRVFFLTNGIQEL